MATLKVGEVIKLLEADGWYLVETKGSHRQFKHPTKPGRVTVPGKLSKDVTTPRPSKLGRGFYGLAPTACNPRPVSHFRVSVQHGEQHWIPDLL